MMVGSACAYMYVYSIYKLINSTLAGSPSHSQTRNQLPRTCPAIMPTDLPMRSIFLMMSYCRSQSITAT